MHVGMHIYTDTKKKRSSKNCGTIHVIRVPEGEMEKNKVEEKFEDVTDKNHPKVMQDIKSQMQEFQRTPSRRN